MSRSVLQRLFHELTGHAPLQYQKRLRLHQAKRLIEQGMAVSQAAYQVGYNSPAQFSRDFKQLFSMPPSHSGLNELAEAKAD